MNPTAPLTITSALGSVSKTGRWQVPAQINATSTMGSVLLDFTEADCALSEIEVHVNCQAGRITLIVPDGWGVDTGTLTANGAGVEVTVGGAPEPDLPLLKITGQVTWGRLVITDSQRYRARQNERADRHRRRDEQHEQRHAERDSRHERRRR
ncbi:hypothetical protein AB0L82_37295 [Nocardia sp. NPDC052001]|uniref:hypothetical protein n=1 Tax=Nocardia sp. NPDC052001 TaxID=3154853 RepID=UPI003434014F